MDLIISLQGVFKNWLATLEIEPKEFPDHEKTRFNDKSVKIRLPGSKSNLHV